MPKVYRAMKKDAATGKPLIGEASLCLGVRPGDKDVTPDADGRVGPGVGRGLSVNASPDEVSPSMVAREYEGQFGIVGARGRPNQRLWRAWDGPFVDGPVAPSLQLAVDHHPHGVIEPDEVMHRDQYQAALSRTVHDWHEVLLR